MSIMQSVIRMIALNGSAAERAELKAMLEGAADTAVMDRPARKGKGKRTLSPEQKAKMAEGRKRAAAAKTAPAVAAPAAKPAKERKPLEAKVEAYRTKKGDDGSLVVFGIMSNFCKKGDEAKRAQVIASINMIRTMPQADMAALVAKIGR